MTTQNLSALIGLLMERYIACNNRGHYAPNNPEKGRCGHCYRNLNPQTPKIDEALKRNKKSRPKIRLDERSIMVKRWDELAEQNKIDVYYGISQIEYLLH